MALLKALCWALIFIIRIRFPPGTSLAMTLCFTLFEAIDNMHNKIKFSLVRKKQITGKNLLNAVKFQNLVKKNCNAGKI